jgi:diguanylate cyclase (GGDEF)-like protein
VLMCDLDHFKNINDRYGHATGAAVLASTARALESAIRETDKVGRHGGEEFIVLLVETEPAFVQEIGERCRAAISAVDTRAIVPAGDLSMTMSVGVAVFPRDADDLDTLTLRADEALYAAKRGGRNCVRQYRAGDGTAGTP